MNYYDVLGIPQSASQEEIRSAYMAQIKFFHPDVFPGDPSIAKVKTLQLNAAYAILRDPVRRAEYDRRHPGPGNPPPSYSDTTDDFNNDSPPHSSANSNSNNDSPRYSSEDKNKKFRRSVVVLCALCSMVIASAFSNGSPINFKSNDSKVESENQSSATGVGKSCPVQFEESPALILPPPTGQILYSDGRECVAPFSVVTRGSDDYYVKLKDASGSQDVIAFFVQGGETAEIDVPLGTYMLYYATGDSWHGEEDLFGESTRYCKADELFDFYESDGYVNGWTVELYTQSNGNLSTESIDPSEF